jgi:4-amino-4-deoxy-L-arabinose transferase-like glycosyltransferase
LTITRRRAMDGAMSREAWAVVVVAVLLRLGFAATTGLGIDESYMVAASQHFAVSYFDHPLASWWMELAARRLIGNADPFTVRLPFVVLSGVTSWLVYLVGARFYGARAGFWAVLAYSVSPVFSLAFGCWVLPDGPLDAALLAAAYAMARALGIFAPASPRWWWAAGFFAGLALLSKYSAALVLAGAVLFLLTDAASRPALRGWRPWAAGLLALAMFSPVVWWNAAHGWQSFHYQSFRAGGLNLHIFAPLRIWGGEALFVLPWLWLPMFLLLIRSVRKGPVERRDWFLAMLGIIPIVLFAAVGVWSSTHILYHWAAPGYLMLFPLLGKWAALWRPTLRNFVAGFSAFLLVAASGLIAAAENIPLIPNLDLLFPPGRSPLLQALDWNSLKPEILGRDVQAVATLRWYDAGKIGYGIRDALPVTVFGPERHEFGIAIPPASLLGKNILLVAMPGDVSAITRAYAPYFKTLAPAPSLTVMHDGAVLMVIPVLLGTDLLAPPPQ